MLIKQNYMLVRFLFFYWSNRYFCNDYLIDTFRQAQGDISNTFMLSQS